MKRLVGVAQHWTIDAKHDARPNDEMFDNTGVLLIGWVLSTNLRYTCMSCPLPSSPTLQALIIEGVRNLVIQSFLWGKPKQCVGSFICRLHNTYLMSDYEQF